MYRNTNRVYSHRTESEVASVRQLKPQIDRHGADKASWHCFWRDGAGRQRSKSFGAGRRGKRDAEKYAKDIEAKLRLRRSDKSAASWASVRADLDELLIGNMSTKNANECRRSLDHFERHCAPKFAAQVDSRMVEKYVQLRRQDTVSKSGQLVAPATVKKELRYVGEALRRAVDWGYIDRMPRIPVVRVPETVKRHMDDTTFAQLYQSCDVTDRPLQLSAVDREHWWQAYLTTLYLTGWRRDQVLRILWEHVDLEAGTLLSPHTQNKGKRDEPIPLHPVIAEHLQKLIGLDSVRVFPWVLSSRSLYPQFEKIQDAAGVEGWAFHDFRRGFATQNAEQLDLFELQSLMQHRSIETTRRYVDMAAKLKRTTDRINVPDVLKGGAE